jgi:hypothetical protein
MLRALNRGGDLIDGQVHRFCQFVDVQPQAHQFKQDLIARFVFELSGAHLTLDDAQQLVAVRRELLHESGTLFGDPTLFDCLPPMKLGGERVAFSSPVLGARHIRLAAR